MKRFRQEKGYLQVLFMEKDWQNRMRVASAERGGAKAFANVLLALLPRIEYKWQAVWSFGLIGFELLRLNKEEGRELVRRLMWSLNEESGNLGWGIPEAMGALLAENADLAGEYTKILFSYIYDTGHEDNYLDHAPLRFGVYWAAGRLASKNFEQVLPFFHILARGLEDEDSLNRLCSVWAVGCLLKAGSGELFRETVTPKVSFVQKMAKAIALERTEAEVLEGDSIQMILAESANKELSRSLKKIFIPFV